MHSWTPFPTVFTHSWRVCTAEICIGSSYPVCPHVLEKCGNFGKRWVFQNKISSVLCRVAFRKWQISWIYSELDDNTRQDQTLFSQEWHFSEWKRYCSVLPSPLPVHKCQHVQRVGCFGLGFLSLVAITLQTVRNKNGWYWHRLVLFTCLSCAYFNLHTPSWRWLISNELLINIGCFLI